ncbi:response regulator transcription factor [Mucilaginibacter pallidiroseus]|uniref:Response regulator transcription factor n=1 Tax=Mucilaginibacter pallidiroseus TaxID=2599295 RepID=A0A563UF18_9SPHI|nr:winged helix-turn-helix domain-containing protein [Mucilaginibacter pallidiroseus]TWR29965.1 response regulator transcription factor [Mucilaginibacter pallidiroseus]
MLITLKARLQQLRYHFAITLLLIACTICVAFSINGPDGFSTSGREVLLRSIGHQLLLQAGDSTSRVLPIKHIAEDEYRIIFEKAFTFRPEKLVNTARQLLAKDPQTDNYIVNVLDAANKDVVYGYAISRNQKDDVVPCKGRLQPKGHYQISVKFKPENNLAKNQYLLGGLPFLALVGFVLLRSDKQGEPQTRKHQEGKFAFGSVVFNPQEKLLTIDNQTIELTGTETRLLRIFASLPNQTIERSRLQKEIWEDEGVIVGRSLDMFISKLRRKLEADPYTNIVVVRGKGYKLEVLA